MEFLEQAVAQLELLIQRAKQSLDTRAVALLISAQTILLDAVVAPRETGGVLVTSDSETDFDAATMSKK